MNEAASFSPRRPHSARQDTYAPEPRQALQADHPTEHGALARAQPTDVPTELQNLTAANVPNEASTPDASQTQRARHGAVSYSSKLRKRKVPNITGARKSRLAPVARHKQGHALSDNEHQSETMTAEREATLIDDHRARKASYIRFSANGPVNQGGTLLASVDPPAIHNVAGCNDAAQGAGEAK